jgi:predicted PurR-regulated permease PerM
MSACAATDMLDNRWHTECARHWRREGTDMAEKMNSLFWMNAKLILFAILAVVLLILLYYSRVVAVVSLLGIGMGVLLAPILSTAKRRFKIPRALGALLCLLVITVVIGGAAFGVWYLVSDQVQSLYTQLPEIYANLKSRAADYPRLRHQLEGLDLAAATQTFASYFFRGMMSSFSAISGFVFALIISLYIAVSMDDYFDGFVGAFPRVHREKAAHVLRRCATTLRLWFRAQLIDMVILGIITGIGLWMVGVDYWAVYGLLTALFAIIPYVGLVIVVLCAVLITLASDPSQVVWVLAVFAVTQQIEGNFVLPMLMKGQVELPEVWLLIFMLFLGTLLGILGVLLAPPLFAVMRILYIELYLPRVDDKTESGETTTAHPS